VLWNPINQEDRATAQFAKNLKIIKNATIEWDRKKNQLVEREFITTEAELQSIYETKGGGFTSPKAKEDLLSLEKKRRQLLQAREAEWRLKSRALWLQNGDENTKLFQAYAKGRKMENTIWGLKDSSDGQLTYFEDLTRLGTQHF